MSNLSNSDINIINIRDNSDSTPLRQNFENLKNAINDNNTRIDNNLTAGGSEVTDARDNFASLQSNIRARKQYGNRVNGFTDLQVVENTGGATSNVMVVLGDGIVNGIGVTKSGTSTSSTITASAAGNHRRIVVVIASDNSISLVEGSEVLTSATAPYPAITDSQLPLGEFLIDDGVVSIADADITDSRLPAIDPFDGIEYFGASATYNADNTLNVLTYTDKKGNDITFTHSYTGFNLTSVVVAYLSITVTNTITYDANNNVTNQAIVLSA